MPTQQTSTPQSSQTTAHAGTSVRCTVCHGSDTESILSIQQIPLFCNVLWPAREDAVAARRGDMDLHFCRQCGHLFNAAFDPALLDYSVDYENSLHFSPRFQSYVDTLAQELVEHHGLHGKTIIEIGSGKGDFLTALCRLGDNRGLGYDPSYAPAPGDIPPDVDVTLIQEAYTGQQGDGGVDFICSRHTLEHIQEPTAFLSTLRRAVGDATDLPIFFEVPNALYTVRDMGIWDLIYEHCSYFTADSLARAFTEAGFRVAQAAETYGGQFLTCTATPRPLHGEAVAVPASSTSVHTDVEQFGRNYRAKMSAVHDMLEEVRRSGRRAVVWGAGSKGVTFLNIFRNHLRVEYVVDINPRKQGMFVAGTGQEIIAPDALKAVRPDLVIVMNPLYVDEIRAMLGERGAGAAILTV